MPNDEPQPTDGQHDPVTPSVSPLPAPANVALLDEVEAAATWFHARKTRPIWARKIQTPQIVQTLEGAEQVAAGHFLCRGEAGDLWPQTERDLLQRYTSTDEIDGEGWRQYRPHPDAQGVMAAPIPHPFSVEAKWGRLSGKAGDFLLKNFSDRDAPYPDDVWIVDQTLFRQTYQSV